MRAACLRKALKLPMLLGHAPKTFLARPGLLHNSPRLPRHFFGRATRNCNCSDEFHSRAIPRQLFHARPERRRESRETISQTTAPLGRAGARAAQRHAQSGLAFLLEGPPNN